MNDKTHTTIPKKPTGQKNTKEKIYGYLREGLYKKDVARMVGIDESTFYRWIEADASFASQVEASILEYKHSLIQNISTSAQNDWRAALEILRRRWPKEWNTNVDIEEQERSDRDTRRLRDAVDEILKDISKDRETSGATNTLSNESSNNTLPELIS